jgi:hypothetical protein
VKKIKFCLAAAILSLSVLSGCGMARDGYIEDRPAQTSAPIESPAATSTPRPEKKPSEKDTAGNTPVDETPMPDAQQTETPNM